VYAQNREMLGKIIRPTYHHIHFSMYEEVEIEARIYPSFLLSPMRNKNLHSFCEEY